MRVKRKNQLTKSVLKNDRNNKKMNEKIIFKSNMVQNKEYAREKKKQLTKRGKICF